jgi:hypothetical protein
VALGAFWIMAAVLQLQGGGILWADDSGPIPLGAPGAGRDAVADLVIGVPQEDLAGSPDINAAGAVHVLYGNDYGPSVTGDDWWTQDVPGVDEAQAMERFGDALAAGDFNGDGRTDLAIGSPGEDAGGVDGSGAVFILYGGDNGFSTSGLQMLDQALAGMPDSAEESDFFGATLAAGDFDHDGFCDLAVGATLEGVDGMWSAGAVFVVYGSLSGLTTVRSPLFLHQNLSGLAGDAENDNRFGSALATGDFNHDGYSDLAIGVPNNTTVEGIVVSDSGAVYVLYGAWYGLVTSSSRFLTQDTISVLDAREINDHFGAALAAGDVNGDGYDDLIVGVPDEDLITGGSSQADAGVFHLFYGIATGIALPGNEVWDQAAAALASDLHGYALAAADFNRDGFDDLAAGVPGDVGGTGSVSVLYGSASGLGSGELWRQGSDFGNIYDTPEAGDWFGAALAAGDLDGDGYDDLVVGVPFEDISTATDAGMVHVIYGSVNGLTDNGDTIFHQLIMGIAGDGIQANDYFGRRLAVIPQSPVVFRDGFESGGLNAWSAP